MTASKSKCAIADITTAGIFNGTVNEETWELRQRKAQTIADVLGEAGFARCLSEADLEHLFTED